MLNIADARNSCSLGSAAPILACSAGQQEASDRGVVRLLYRWSSTVYNCRYDDIQLRWCRKLVRRTKTFPSVDTQQLLLAFTMLLAWSQTRCRTFQISAVILPNLSPDSHRYTSKFNLLIQPCLEPVPHHLFSYRHNREGWGS